MLGRRSSRLSMRASRQVNETPSPPKASSATTTLHSNAPRSTRSSASVSRAATSTCSLSGSVTPATSAESGSIMKEEDENDGLGFLSKDIHDISKDLDHKRRFKDGGQHVIILESEDDSMLSDVPEAMTPASSSTTDHRRMQASETSLTPKRPTLADLSSRSAGKGLPSGNKRKAAGKDNGKGKKRELSSDSDLSDIPTIEKVVAPPPSKRNKGSAERSSSRFRKLEPALGDKPEVLEIDDYDDTDSVTGSVLTSDVCDDDEDSDDPIAEIIAFERAQKRYGRAVPAASASEGGFVVEDDDEGEGEGEDQIGPSTTANSGPARGSMQEEQQYETAKQREKRIKRELREAKRKQKITVSHYEKVRIKLNAHHPELRHLWEDMKELPTRTPVAGPQPKGLTIKLLPFQLEGVNWLVEQEKSEWKGGILADEMGMGKTIQMISLFLSDYDQKKGSALVIAPTVAIVQWRNEIEKYTHGMKVLIWHGQNKMNSVKELKKYDVVLTSYQTLERAFSKQVKGWRRKGEIIKEDSALHTIHWHRIVLDEAHNIKERATNVAKASFELEGDYRWCLSGTPLQNRVGELYSMIRFLGGDPFAYYYCLKCECKSLHWNFPDRRSCEACGHTPMHHTCFWNNEILKPIQRGGMEVGEGKDAFGRLRILLERLMLRRTKLERADDMGLPPRTVEVRRDMFNEEEEDLYESLYKDITRKFSTYLDQGTVLNNYSNIFTLLTRMRLMSNHPDLVLRSNTGLQQNLLSDEAGVENRVCKICTDVAEDPIMSKCKHVFCRECMRQYLETDLGAGAGCHDCPYCHATLSIDLEQEAIDAPAGLCSARQGIVGRLNMDKWRSSTKIEALVEELTSLRSEDKTIKSLVFSQFVNFLDLIAFRLQRAGFSICRLEGNMSPEARDKTIKHFMNNPHVTVFLVSLKAGGVALNLTEASRVFLMDPWWNPSVEVQAMDRIHRLGQHRPIIVKRMIIENSIEARIIELQNKKSAMIEAAIGKDDSAMGRLSVRDLRFLFTL